jgi:integrase
VCRTLRTWLDERAAADAAPLFVSNRGGRPSRDAIERIVRKHVTLASDTCPTLKGKRVTPHVLRHSAAMQLLQNGLDRMVALWTTPRNAAPISPMGRGLKFELRVHGGLRRQPLANDGKILRSVAIRRSKSTCPSTRLVGGLSRP